MFSHRAQLPYHDTHKAILHRLPEYHNPWHRELLPLECPPGVGVVHLVGRHPSCHQDRGSPQVEPPEQASFSHRPCQLGYRRLIC